ncbi:hypothetical protein KY329_04235 [Candidatus Woesearchaeota archaeon]|nr:hypothetical protein [Candidatus Woesearchaeota archaeon]
MGSYKQILQESRLVDARFKQSTKDTVVFPVPKSHPRYKQIQSYNYSEGKIEVMDPDSTFLVDETITKLNFVKEFIKDKKVYILPAVESEVKTINFLDKFIKEHNITGAIVVIGGGLLCNCGAYIAEKIGANYSLVPTTVLAMADGALGGKVRANKVNKNIKHYYKTYYEPNAVFFDSRFLKSLRMRQKRIGIVEIIKHSLFQSEALYNFILDNVDKILKDDQIMKKAIFWTADLKRVCIELDPDETGGSLVILRGGHDISDRLEEQKDFKIPHGFAVAIGIMRQLKDNKELQEKTKVLFDKLLIPATLQDLAKFH